MRSVRSVLLGVVSCVVVGSGVAWTGSTGVAARAEQTQASLSAAAAALHKDAIVIDGHVHLTTAVFHMGFDPWKPQSTGLFDFARAKQGGLDVAIEHIYIEDAYDNYNYAVKQACRLIETFHRILDANRDKMELALTSADVRRIVAKGKMAVILALEGGFDMEGDLDILRLFYRLGVRMIQLTNHDMTNAFVDAWPNEPKWHGINDRGRAVIREMNRLGIIVDAAHASEEAVAQMIEASQAPIVNSHTAVRHFSNGLRTMSDEALRALATKGGMMGMFYSAGAISKKFQEWETAQRPAEVRNQVARLRRSGELSRGRETTMLLPNKGVRSPDQDYGEYISALDAEMHDKWTRERSDRGGGGYGRPWREQQRALVDAGAPLPTDEEWADVVDHVVRVIGDDHIGLGLNLMSGGAGLRDFDATSYPRLTQAMLAKGLAPKTIRKILGENWLRMLDTAKVAGAASSSQASR